MPQHVVPSTRYLSGIQEIIKGRIAEIQKGAGGNSERYRAAMSLHQDSQDDSSSEEETGVPYLMTSRAVGRANTARSNDPSSSEAEIPPEIESSDDCSEASDDHGTASASRDVIDVQGTAPQAEGNNSQCRRGSNADDWWWSCSLTKHGWLVDH